MLLVSPFEDAWDGVSAAFEVVPPRVVGAARVRGHFFGSADVPINGWSSTCGVLRPRLWPRRPERGVSQKVVQGGTPMLAPLGYLHVRRTDDAGRETRTVEVDAERAPLVAWAFTPRRGCLRIHHHRQHHLHRARGASRCSVRQPALVARGFDAAPMNG